MTDHDASAGSAVLRAILHTFSHDIVERDGLLLLLTRQIAEWSLLSPPADPVDVEATMNKRYVAELLGGAVEESARDELMVWGRAVVQVWAERIACRFPGRNVLFYLGGSDGVILRFHVRRSGMHDWIDLSDREFLVRSAIEVYELREGRLGAAGAAIRPRCGS